MALKLKKKTVNPSQVEQVSQTEVVAAAQIIQTPLQKSIDKVGDLQVQLQPKIEEAKKITAALAPLKTAMKDLGELVAGIEDADEATGTIEAERFNLDYGKMGSSREVTDLKAVHQMLGDELFYQLAGIPLTSLDEYLTPEQRAKCITTNPSKRSFKVVPK